MQKGDPGVLVFDAAERKIESERKVRKQETTVVNRGRESPY